MTLKRCLWCGRGEKLSGVVPRKNAKRGSKAENINNPLAQFCWKDEKWIILEENMEGKGFCFVLFFKEKRY